MIQQFHEFFELGPIVRRILKKSITTKFEWVTTNMLFSNFLQREDIFLGLLLVTTALTTTTSPFEFPSLGANQRLDMRAGFASSSEMTVGPASCPSSWNWQKMVKNFYTNLHKLFCQLWKLCLHFCSCMVWSIKYDLSNWELSTFKRYTFLILVSEIISKPTINLLKNPFKKARFLTRWASL